MTSNHPSTSDQQRQSTDNPPHKWGSDTGADQEANPNTDLIEDTHPLSTFDTERTQQSTPSSLYVLFQQQLSQAGLHGSIQKVILSPRVDIDPWLEGAAIEVPSSTDEKHDTIERAMAPFPGEPAASLIDTDDLLWGSLIYSPGDGDNTDDSRNQTGSIAISNPIATTEVSIEHVANEISRTICNQHVVDNETAQKLKTATELNAVEADRNSHPVLEWGLGEIEREDIPTTEPQGHSDDSASPTGRTSVDTNKPLFKINKEDSENSTHKGRTGDSKRKRAIKEESSGMNCPDCGGRVRTSSKEEYCLECGAVICDETVDPGKEWRVFDASNRSDKKRTGMSTTHTQHDGGLSTKIGRGFKDAYGNTISQEKQQRLKRLRKWNTRAQSHVNKANTKKTGLGEIKRLVSELDTPDRVAETASMLFCRAADEDIISGRSIEATATAAVYCAIRQDQLPIRVDMIETYARVDRIEITRTYRHLVDNFNLEIAPTSIISHLDGIAAEVTVTRRTRDVAEKLLKELKSKNKHCGKDPGGIVAGSLYAASLITRADRFTQDEVAEAGNVCVVTVRDRLDEFDEITSEEVNTNDRPKEEEVASRREELPKTQSELIGVDETTSAKDAEEGSEATSEQAPAATTLPADD